MFRSLFMFLFLIVALATPACTCGTVDPGHVGVVVKMSGENSGVAPEELGVGFYFISPLKRVYEFPVFEQQYSWDKAAPVDESFTFQTKEGLTVNADIGISYHIKPDSVASVFQRYRRPIEDIQSVFLHNLVRDALVEVGSTMEVEQVYGVGKSKFIKDVHERVRAELTPIGIEVTKISLIGEFRLPPSVQQAINGKMEATQLAMKAQNELATATAEAAKKVATAQGDANARLANAEADAKAILLRATAEAQANALLGKSITPTLVDYQRAKAWDGKMPSTILGGDTTVLFGGTSK